MNYYLKAKVSKKDLNDLGYEEMDLGVFCKIYNVNSIGMAKNIVKINLNKKPSKIVLVKLMKNGYQTVKTKKSVIKDLVKAKYVVCGE